MTVRVGELEAKLATATNGRTATAVPTVSSEVVRYIWASVLAVVSLVLRAGLTPLFGFQYPFITAYFAVAIAARFLGTGPALLTTVISLFGALYFFAPQGREGFDFNFGIATWVGLFLNFLFNALIAWFVGSLKTEKESGEIARRSLENADLELRARALELRKANESQSALLAAVAHELRNPLHPVLLAASLIRARPDDATAVVKAAELIERQALHARRLTNDLVDLSSVGLQKLELQLARIDLSIALRSAIEQLESQIRAKQQRLHLTGLEEKTEFLGDLGRLTQVFSNLLSNASRYTPAGGDIWVEQKIEGGRAVVSVRDSGEGIESERLGTIFELFVQGSVSGSRQQGLGIGLALVRTLVEMHGGTVAASSGGRHRGATFTVVLPMTA